MKLDRRSLFASAATVAFLYLLASVIGLPGWAGVLIAVLVLAGVGFVVKEADPRPAPIVLPVAEPAPPKKEPEPDQVFRLPPTRAVSNVLLPSASAEFQFSFSAVVHWSPVRSGSRHADLGAVAVDAVLERARALTVTQQPTQESLNRYRLAAQLSRPDLDEVGQVRCWATDVHLRLPEADSKHLSVLTALHRREQAALLERRMERDSRTYLQEEVLASPGSAVVWWLVNNPGEVEKAADLLSTFTKLSAATTEDDSGAIPVASTTELTALLARLPDDKADSSAVDGDDPAGDQAVLALATPAGESPGPSGEPAEAQEDPADAAAAPERQNGRYREEFFSD